MSHIGVDHRNPNYQTACAFIEYLVANDASPPTVRNIVSQVRVYLRLSELHIGGFNHPRVSRALDAIDRNKAYVSRAKEPINADILTAIIYSMPRTPLGNTIRLANLVLYYGALRQSELLPRTSGTWSPHIQPMRKDCHFENNRCVIYIKTAKNLQKYNQSGTVDMGTADDNLLCPVRTMWCVIQATPTRNPNDPLLMIPGSRKPLPSSLVLKQLHETMRVLGLGSIVHVTSLHSLRKTAATSAYSAGCSETSIKNYGAWSSATYTSYINTSNKAVNQHLINSIAK